MFSLGFPQRKYVYPTIMLICLFILLLRYAYAAEMSPAPRIPDRVRDDMRAAGRQPHHSEGDFLNASERFNERLNDPFLELNLPRHETRVRNMTNDWRRETRDPFDARLGRLRETRSMYGATPPPFDSGLESLRDPRTSYGDTRYSQERRRLDDMRTREMNDYRERRLDIQNRMSGYNRSSREYDRLEREMQDLDRLHAEKERRFEREFRNMDANYSVNRW